MVHCMTSCHHLVPWQWMEHGPNCTAHKPSGWTKRHSFLVSLKFYLKLRITIASTAPTAVRRCKQGQRIRRTYGTSTTVFLSLLDTHVVTIMQCFIHQNICFWGWHEILNYSQASPKPGSGLTCHMYSTHTHTDSFASGIVEGGWLPVMQT